MRWLCFYNNTKLSLLYATKIGFHKNILKYCEKSHQLAYGCVVSLPNYIVIT